MGGACHVTIKLYISITVTLFGLFEYIIQTLMAEKAYEHTQTHLYSSQDEGEMIKAVHEH